MAQDDDKQQGDKPKPIKRTPEQTAERFSDHGPGVRVISLPKDSNKDK